MRHNGLNQTGHTNTTLDEQPEALRALFKQLASGQTPNFLEMMAAISDLVAFNVDTDSIQEDHTDRLLKRSGKKCRFCS